MPLIHWEILYLSIEQFLWRCAKVSTVMLKHSISFCLSLMKHMLDPSCEAEDLDLLILPTVSQALGLKEYTSMNGILCWGPNLGLCGSLESTLSADSHPLIPESLYFRYVFPPEPIGSIFLILVYDLLLKQNYFT